MHYTLHQLQVFLTVCKHKSVTKAAEELHLTQPAVSIQLKKLQDQFEIPLVEIVGRQLYVTDFGEEIVKTAEKMIKEVDDIKNKTLSYKGLLAGQLKISVASTGKYVMPYFLAEFLENHPGIDILMDVTNKAKVVESLTNNQIDFALVSVLPENLEVDRVELMNNVLNLVRKLPTNDKVKRSISIKDLENIPLIYREKGSATRKSMEKFVQELNIPLKKSIELTSNEAVKQAVMAGLGYSVMPLIGLKNEILNKQLEVVPIKGLPIYTQWNLIWLKQKSLSPIAKAYLDFITKNKENLIKENFHWFENQIVILAS